MRSHIQVVLELGVGSASWFEGWFKGPTMRPDPRRLSRVSFVKTWFNSERKKSTDPKAIAAPTNGTGRLVRKTTSVSSFHSALLVQDWDRREQSKLRPATTQPRYRYETCAKSSNHLQTVFADSMAVPLL